MKKIIAAATIVGAGALLGGVAQAEDYPPKADIESASPTPESNGTLPATGGSSSTTLWAAGSLLVVGAGLVTAADSRRRRNAEAS